jgi:hypothetical protein
MNNYELVEWQKIAPNGLVYPWLTWPFLDLIETWDLSGKTMLEFGAGRGSAYWWKRCKWVDSIESNAEWTMKSCDDIGNNLLHDKGQMHYIPVSDGVDEEMPLYFDAIPKDRQYDIILIDGLYRYECLKWALNHFKGRGGILIFDNWDQDFVFISEQAEQLMSKYEIHIFAQPGHVVHEGKPWKTVYWKIPA